MTKKLTRFFHFVKDPKTGAHTARRDVAEEVRSNHFTWNENDVIVKKADQGLKEEKQLDFGFKQVKQPGPKLGPSLEKATSPSLDHFPVVSPNPNWITQQMKHRGEWSDQHHQARIEYKLESSEYINNELRDYGNYSHHNGLPHIPVDHYHVDRASHMEHVTRHPIGKEMHVYRGWGSNFDVSKLGKGDEITDHGFTGCSFNRTLASSFGKKSYTDSHVIRHATRIHLPAHTKGHYLDADPHDGSGYGDEEELLLHRGSTFKVMGHTIHDNGELWHPKADKMMPCKLHLVHLKFLHQKPKPIVPR